MYLKRRDFHYEDLFLFINKIIDDFALMTFFVGNDFLPNLPSLEINQNAFGILFDLYKQLVPTIGYLHDRGKLNIKTCFYI